VGNLTCTGCHNGTYNNYGAMPKDSNHVTTTADCGTCHTAKDTPTHTNADWSIPLNVIHNGITTGCVSCHDGAHPPALGKVNYTPGHPVTSDACETCHSINASFKCASLIEDKLFMKLVKQRFVWTDLQKKLVKKV